MPFAGIEAYLSELELRKTEVKMMMADVVMLPNMKKRDREATINRWMKLLKIHSSDNTKIASPARLKMMGIGVRHVSK